MKVVPNGGLNLSVLDGWWAEAYRPGVGWAIGTGKKSDHPGYQDQLDAESLYSLLENEIVPLFYSRDADGLPRGWIAMMKESIKVLAPTFSGDRMVKQYAECFYMPGGRPLRPAGRRRLRRGQGIGGLEGPGARGLAGSQDRHRRRRRRSQGRARRPGGRGGRAGPGGGQGRPGRARSGRRQWSKLSTAPSTPTAA